MASRNRRAPTSTESEHDKNSLASIEKENPGNLKYKKFILTEMPTDCTVDHLGSIPEFLEKAAGVAATDPVVVTFYGGDKGSNHLRWRPKTMGGGALPAVWNDDIREEVAKRLHSELKEGRQLGFIAAHGGSKKQQITHISCLRAEIDLPDSKDLQRLLYKALEQRYGIRLTLLDTGGKSIHAWLPTTTAIPSDQYRETSELWHQKIEETAQDAGIVLPHRALDRSCHKPTQPMRLPGAIHIKTGRRAEVIQWSDGPVDLKQLGLDWVTVQEWYKSKAAPQKIVQSAIERTCQHGTFFGFTGDKRLEELVSLARSVPVRVPGAGTYQGVLALVASLSRALGAEQAAGVLHRAGHLDKEGNPSLDGLREWCETFEPEPNGAPRHLAWLAAWAEREQGWKRPILHVSGVLEATELVEPDPGAISDSLFSQGGGVMVCRTGTGKTLGAIAYVDQVNANWSAAIREFSVVAITPRRTINSQVAAQLGAVNVSGQLNSKGDPYRQPGTQPNRYVCCLPSLGNSTKRNGKHAFWGDYWTLGDAGTSPVATGRGAIVTVLILDEVRQMVTDLLLSASGPGTLWETPAHRWLAGISLVRTIKHAGVVLAMDAQAGEPERELLKGIGRRESTRILGCPTSRPSRTMLWTSNQKRWRDCLLGHAKNRGPENKPLLVVTGAKGKEGKGRRGLSARGLKDALLQAVPEIRVLIIDGDSKDGVESLRVLGGDVQGWDVVICTPVAQSGVSWVEKFSKTVFVAGGRTLPPNICGGQAGRRERTATTCVAYVPKTVYDSSLPLMGREATEIRAELRQAREKAKGLVIAKGWEVEILEEVYVLAAKRQIEELALFLDYTLHYAAVDGWAAEELKDIPELPNQETKKYKQKKQTEPIALSELDPWRRLLVDTLRLQGVGAERQVAEGKSNAVDETTKNMTGSAGADLISANLAEVHELLLKAELWKVCDGKFRAGDDPLVKAVAKALQSTEARRVIRNAAWLKLDLKGSTTYPARTVGATVSSLGGMSNTRKAGSRGNQKMTYKWTLPGDW